MSSKITTICILVLTFSSFLEASNAAYNVINYGAKPNGKTDSTKAFLKAWSLACNSRGQGATVYVPRGNYLVKPITFSGPCKSKISFRIEGKIVAPTNYWIFGSSGYWILFYKVSKLTIYGGTIDANGASFWSCRKRGKSCPLGARSISFLASSNILVHKLTTVNSQLFHISIYKSHDIVLQNLKITAPSWSPNTDGIHIQSSTGITIAGSTIMTGDDCISMGPGSRNVWIQRIACGPGHGISVGSLALYGKEEGVQNVTVANVVFKGTQNGVRIKSWAKPTNGFARRIEFRDIFMQNVYNPIIIDQRYCPSGKGCSTQHSGVKISGVTYKNIRGTSATQVALKFVCSGSNPCTALNLQNINLRYVKGTATSYCSHAHGRRSGVVKPRSCL